MIRCQTDIALFEKTYEHIIKTVGLSRWEDDGTRRKSATLHCVDEMPDDEDKGILAKFCMGLAHNIRGVQALRLPPVEKIERAREMLRQITGADPTLTWYRCAESSY